MLIVLQASLSHATVILMDGSFFFMVGCNQISIRFLVPVSLAAVQNALFSLVAVATEAGLLWPPDSKAMRGGVSEKLDLEIRLSSLFPATVAVCSSLAVVVRCLWLLKRTEVRNAGRRGGARRTAHARIFGADGESQNRRGRL